MVYLNVDFVFHKLFLKMNKDSLWVETMELTEMMYVIL